MKKLDRISVKNENTVFGIERKAGFIVYDQTAKKMYVLLTSARAIDSLASIVDKKELGGGFDYVLTVGDFFGIQYGYSIPDSHGSLTPDTFEGELLSQVAVSNGTKNFIVTPDSGSIIGGHNSLNVSIEGFGDIVVTWTGIFYSANSIPLTDYFIANSGNDLGINITGL